MSRRAVRFTSLEALRKHTQSGARCTSRHKVLQAIVDSEGGLTRAEIAQATEYGVNVVCGRVSEMIQDGILQDVGQHKECSLSGNLVHCVTLNPDYQGKAY